MSGDRLNDAALMRQVAAGEASASRRLVADHLDNVFGLAWRMLGDAAAAEDVAQEAFFRLWRQAGRWRPEALVATWLYRVAHNLCVDRLRGRQRLAGVDVPELADPADGPEAGLQRKQVAAAVESAIAGLPERQRTAITLVHHQEQGNVEAAEIMGISVEALESLLARGRRSLRDRLAGLRADLEGGTE